VTQEENDDNSDGYSGSPHLEYVTQEENDNKVVIDIMAVFTLSMRHRRKMVTIGMNILAPSP
jgi:hypothetical protein